MNWKKSASLLLVCLLSAAAASAQLAANSDALQLIDKLALPLSEKPASKHHRWRKPRRVLAVVPSVYTLVVPDMAEQLRDVAAASGVELLVFEASNSIQPDFRDVGSIDVFMGWCFPALRGRAGGSLRWVQLYDASAPGCLGDGFSAPIVSNMQGLDAPNQAEHALAMLFALNSRLLDYYSEQQKGRWNRRLALQLRGNEIQGQTLLLLGYNPTALEIARKAAALGMHVIASSDSVKDAPFFIDYLAKSHQLPDLASQADIVINVQDRTKGDALLVNEAFFGGMRRGALYISLAEQGLTAYDDLVKALRQGRLAGAAIDPAKGRALDANSALWRMPNVLITPGVSAANSRQAVQRKVAFLRENLRRYIAGEKLLNIQRW
jgi:phosphoglycerate dehydrogenase-like enzyme